MFPVSLVFYSLFLSLPLASFFRSTGKNEFRRNELPNNIGLSTSIASVVTPNGSGRATPVANGGVPVVEEFPPDIQYYVDFAPIGDPSLTPTKAAVLSPVIPGVPGTAIVPTPAYALSAPPPAATSSEYLFLFTMNHLCC